MKTTRKTLGILMVIGLLLLFSFSLGHATIPDTMTYQGYLEGPGGSAVNGTVSIMFSLYTAPSGGIAVWWETLNVEVKKGVFSVILGKTWPLSALPFDVSYYLGVKVGDDSEMTPRTELTSTGYSFRAATAELALDLNCSQCISQDELDFTIDGGTVNAGNGLTKEGDTLHVGAGPGIAVQPDIVSIAEGGVITSMLGNDVVITEKLHGNAVTNEKIADNAVGSAKIINLSIGPQDLAAGAVTTDKISSAGASTGQVLKYNGSSVVWEIDQAGGLTLPYGGSANSISTAFAITQNGTGWGMNVESNGVFGIRGKSSATDGAGVGGYNYSSGGVGVFGQGSSKGIYGFTTETGAYGVRGEATGSGGTGVYGSGPAWGGYFTGRLYASGNVGIGTTSPARKLHLFGSGPRILIESNDAFAPEVNFKSSGTPDWAIYKHGATGDLRFYQNGDQVTIKNGTGRLQVKVLQILGGSDLSEEFDVRATDEAHQPSPGMIVSIDPHNAGKLIVSSKAHDKKVAGVISGAGGINTGMLMGQNNSVADGSNPVALTGRVYCLADASYGPIEPGDLLTTSDTPGHAMRVGDHDAAQGAIIGKAMTFLNEGQGLVLVLVTLQ